MNGAAMRRLRTLLARCGVEPDGPAAHDLQIRDPRFATRVLARGSIGLGESYMDGWWDAPSLDGFLFRVLDARLDQRVHTLADLLVHWQARWFDRQRGHRAFAVGERHYDIGNDLFEAMLGIRLVYSCGYWVDATTLDEAQRAKLDLVCRKLRLQPGMRLLDIGCGWGETLKYAAETYGIRGVGITVSREQAAYARERCAGLPVEIRVQDYREVEGQYDAVCSIGMFEHVGSHHYADYMDVVRRHLADGGLSLLHTIGSHEAPDRPDPWIARYIFPNSQIPTAAQVAAAIDRRFVVEDWHNFGNDYDLTLQAWRDNVEAAWKRLPARYDERFRRMWRYYLALSMAAFRSRRLQLWQLVLSPQGVPGGYRVPR